MVCTNKFVFSVCLLPPFLLLRLVTRQCHRGTDKGRSEYRQNANVAVAVCFLSSMCSRRACEKNVFAPVNQEIWRPRYIDVGSKEDNQRVGRPHYSTIDWPYGSRPKSNISRSSTAVCGRLGCLWFTRLIYLRVQNLKALSLSCYSIGGNGAQVGW